MEHYWLLRRHFVLTAASSRAPKEIRSSTSSRPLRLPSRPPRTLNMRWEQALPGTDGHSHRRAILTAEGYAGLDVHKAARVPPPPTAVKCAVERGTRPDRLRYSTSRSWGTQAQGLRRTRLVVPVRHEHVPTAQDDLEHKPAPVGELVRGRRREAHAVSSLIRNGSRLVTLTGSVGRARLGWRSRWRPGLCLNSGPVCSGRLGAAA